MEPLRGCARLILAVAACMIVATAVPVLFGWRSYVVLSGSMTPSIWTGDVVIAAPPRPGDLSPGRIVVFREPGTRQRILVHRVDRVLLGGALNTKGDANARADSTPVPTDDVRGVVRLRVPAVGLPVFWLRTHAWSYVVSTAVLILGLIRFGSSATSQPPSRHRRHAYRHGRRRAGTRCSPQRHETRLGEEETDAVVQNA